MQDCVTFTQVGGKKITVRSTVIPWLGTRVYSAWEPTGKSEERYWHAVVDYRSEPLLGRIGTLIPTCYKPFGAERDDALRALVKLDEMRAYAAICHAYPGLACRLDTHLRGGEIEVLEPESAKAGAPPDR